MSHTGHYNCRCSRQRRMENDISFIRGALAVAIPGFKEGMEELVAEASEEESVSEAVGD